MPRFANSIFAIVLGLVVAMIFIGVSLPSDDTDSHAGGDDVVQDARLESKESGTRRERRRAADTPKALTTPAVKQHPIIIRQPSGPPRIELAGTDPQGRTGAVACSTCHAVRQPNLENVSAATLDEFHQGMTFNHGTIACYACHNPDGSDTLRLADGRRLGYESVMTLCAQCHGPQMTAYAHGAHGGMNGHWDLTRGPQMKNNCIDCHDPHAPSYPNMVVGFKPKDRFHEPISDDRSHEGEESHDHR